MNNTSNATKTKILTRSKLLPIICEAIAVNVSEEKKWTSIRKVRNYIEKYFDFSDNYLKRNFPQCIKEMEKQKIIAKKASAVSFLYSGNYNDQINRKRAGRKKKETTNPTHPNLGPDVVITRSGRVSIIHKEDE